MLDSAGFSPASAPSCRQLARARPESLVASGLAQLAPARRGPPVAAPGRGGEPPGGAREVAVGLEQREGDRPFEPWIGSVRGRLEAAPPVLPLDRELLLRLVPHARGARVLGRVAEGAVGIRSREVGR